MPLNTTGKNNLISITSFTHASALTALPSTETTPVTRQAITWAAASGGTRANSAQITIAIAAGQTIVASAMYDALSAGNIQGYGQIGSTLRGASTMTAAGVHTSVGHGLVADDRVFVTAVGGDALPTGLALDTIYFVRATGLTADSFSLATTSGGAAVGSAAGEVAWFKTVPQTFAIAGNLILPATTGLVIDATAFG
jgi:hypothetical protein